MLHKTLALGNCFGRNSQSSPMSLSLLSKEKSKNWEKQVINNHWDFHKKEAWMNLIILGSSGCFLQEESACDSLKANNNLVHGSLASTTVRCSGMLGRRAAAFCLPAVSWDGGTEQVKWRRGRSETEKKRDRRCCGDLVVEVLPLPSEAFSKAFLRGVGGLNVSLGLRVFSLFRSVGKFAL